jgi:hypothetical protein
VGSSTLDYKTFLGIAGTIIAALAVVVWGYLSGDATKQAATNGKQWELLSEMGKAHVRLESDTNYLKRDVEQLRREQEENGRAFSDIREQLRALEHRGERR